jgi:CRISPR-associated exonuclease Cas4
MSSPSYLLILFIFLLILGGVVLRLARRRQKQTGLPEGRLRYSDTGAWKKVEKPYFDAQWGLTGKPDYVVESNGMLIPVEVKSTAAVSPYDSHVLQLAAYCRLVHVTSGNRPSHGLLSYRNRVFEIEYTHALEERLRLLVEEVRSTDPWTEVARSHHSAARCRGCGYAQACEQRLEGT